MHARGSILVVDDEPTIGEVVSAYLQRAGYETRVAADGHAALAAVAERSPDLVVLDLMLPGVDGLEVMRRIRERTVAAARSSCSRPRAASATESRACGSAPMTTSSSRSPRASWWRVDAVLRRVDTVPTSEPALTFDALEIDPGARQVRCDGALVALTTREFDLLLFLARHAGRALTREQLMDHVWQYAFYSDTSTVTVHIRRLRAKLERDPEQPRWIETVWGVGYRFAG